MNPLNLWVALIEILILLGVAFGLGRGIAWVQYRQRIQTEMQAIQKRQKELKKFTELKK